MNINPAGTWPAEMFEDETAQYVRRSRSTLRYWRREETGPPWFKVGRRVMYRRADVDTWLAKQYAVTNEVVA